MNPHELMIKVNHFMIKGGVFTEPQRNDILSELLAAESDASKAKSFYYGVKLPNNTDIYGRRMYPVFFIPHHNDGKKLKTILNQTPKTQILSANMYELEIIRLLYLLSPENVKIKTMVEQTLTRLKTTCFGYADDGVGECFDASLVVLRFLASVVPDERQWIYSRIENYNKHYGEKKRTNFPKWYYWICLSELSYDIAEPEILKYKSEISDLLKNKSFVMNNDVEKTIHPVLMCILRNVISRCPEYAYIKARQPYIKNGRLYFDIQQ